MSSDEYKRGVEHGFQAAINALTTASNHDLPGLSAIDIRLCIIHLKQAKREYLRS